MFSTIVLSLDALQTFDVLLIWQLFILYNETFTILKRMSNYIFDKIYNKEKLLK